MCIRDRLGTRPSVLNPLWYAGAFGLGLIAGRLGDRVSLGFVVETERQVERHLDGHLAQIPQADARSRAILEHMLADEARHATLALESGGEDFPPQLKELMRLASRLMTASTYRV